MLWPQVFVIFCVVLDITNGYYYYPNNHRHRHRHVYNCGRNQRCGRRRGPPACKQWCVVYYKVGNCQQTRYECCRYNEKPGYCPQDPAVCSWPYPYYSTKTYECHHDFNCPSGYKCCQDSCYVHKVCKPLRPCTTVSPGSNQTTTTSIHDTEETTTNYIVTKLPTTTPEAVPTTPQETTMQPTTTTTETTVETTPTPTTTPTTTTEESLITTVRPTETTTVEIIPTEEITTTSRAVETTAALLTTTIASTQTTAPPTTENPTTSLTTTDLSQQTTTLDEELGGSGDYEVPEPESQRFIQGDPFGGLSDDEDFVQNVMDYQIVRV